MGATKQSMKIKILYSLVRKTKFDLILHIRPIPKKKLKENKKIKNIEKKIEKKLKKN